MFTFLRKDNKKNADSIIPAARKLVQIFSFLYPRKMCHNEYVNILVRILNIVEGHFVNNQFQNICSRYYSDSWRTTRKKLLCLLFNLFQFLLKRYILFTEYSSAHKGVPICSIRC